MLGSVQDSLDVRRVVSLPRRTWAAGDAAALAESMTATLRTRHGAQTLRPIQAVALLEIAQQRGGLLPIRVGAGKTLISLLAPRMVGAVRPLLLLPAHLRDKTERELSEYRKDWILPGLVRIESYQTLSRVGAARLLEDYQPDLIVADEGHFLKNPSAACTKRVSRYLRAHRDTAFVVMSGTLTKKSVRDFAHLANWALGDKSPAPSEWVALDEWSRALDVSVAEHRQLAPGALGALRESPIEPLRRAYRRRLTETPGVVATQDQPLPIPLTIRSILIDDLPPVVLRAYATLRRDWTTPDGWPIEDGVVLWGHARELSSGFYSVWDPRPPREWIEARKAWAAECREVLTHNRRGLDTELQVRLAVRDGQYPELVEVLSEWEQIRPTFEPNSVPVWLTDVTIDRIVRWEAEHGPALIWTDRPCVGERLAARGLPYYGQMGLTSDGRFIEQHDPRKGSAVVSIGANCTGRNLQAWHTNLVVDVSPDGGQWEQLLGRTHRDGQTQPVTCDVLFGCIEDVSAFWTAVKRSAYAEEITGQAQKLSHADLESVCEYEEAPTVGPQWERKRD